MDGAKQDLPRWIIYAVPRDHPTPVHIWCPDDSILKCSSLEIKGPSRVVSRPHDDPLETPEGQKLRVWVETISAMHMEGHDGGV